MSETLAERFARDQGSPQQVGDELVHGIYRRKVQAGTQISVRLRSGKTEPVQGVCMKLHRGQLAVESVSAAEIVLWTDTAPKDSSIRVASVKGDEAELRVWNCWLGSHGSTDAWLGDAGMVIVEAGDTVTLRCSDGRPGFSSSDLIVELAFEGPPHR